MIYAIVYGAVALAIVVGSNAYPVWREGMGDPMKDTDAEGWHIGGTMAGIFWPLVLAAGPLAWLMIKMVAGLRQGIVAIARSEKARRERVALKELRLKDLADQGRYVTEDGPHRSR